MLVQQLPRSSCHAQLRPSGMGLCAVVAQLPLSCALPPPSLPRLSCKFSHPLELLPELRYNSLNLLRPGEPTCAYYSKHWRWVC